MADIRFVINISDCTYPPRGLRGETMMRFTLTWALILSDKTYGDSMEGCLAHLQSNGTIKWNPHFSNFGPRKLKQCHTITPDLYDLVRKTIEESEHVKHMRPSLDDQGAIIPQDLDPTIPKILVHSEPVQ